MKHYVYKFTFPNGKVYIGSTQDIDVRWQYNGTLYQHQAVGKAIEEFGWENVEKEVVYFSLISSEVEAEEKRLIALYGDNSYNCSDNPNWKMQYKTKPTGRKGGYVHVWTINGETKPASDWCKIYGKDLANTLVKIEKYHMTPLEAMSAPKVPRGRKPTDFWREAGFKYGKDKTSYVTPLSEWPDDLEKADELKEASDTLILGAAIKEMVKRSGMTKQQIADKAGRNIGTLSRAFATNNATVDTLIEIADAAGFKITITRDDDTPITIVNPGKIRSKQKRTVRPGNGNGLSENGHS